MTDLPLTLPAIVGRVIRSTERITLAEEITLHNVHGQEFRTRTLVVLTVDDEVTVHAVGVTGRQRVLQAQVLDPDEQEELHTALDGVSGVHRLRPISEGAPS